MSSSQASTRQGRQYRLTRSRRLTKARDIRRVLVEGKRFGTRLLEVRVIASPIRHGRIAVVMPRYGYSAVARNKVLRRLRELVRQHLLVVLAGWDVVLRGRREAYCVGYDELRVEILKLLDFLR